MSSEDVKEEIDDVEELDEEVLMVFRYFVIILSWNVIQLLHDFTLTPFNAQF